MKKASTKPKILYVDHDEESLMVFKLSFRLYYDIVTARSADEALALLEYTTVDVILSDHQIPGMTAPEFMHHIPEEPYNIRMLLISDNETEAIGDAENSGRIYRYISKPWDKDALKAEIDSAMLILSEQRENKQVLANAERERLVPDDAQKSVHKTVGEHLLELELMKKDDENQQINKHLEKVYKNVHLLSEIGQNIISNLTIDSIIDSTYENVNVLMDANTFGIGIFDPAENRIELTFIEKGAKLPYVSAYLTEENRLPVWCFKHQDEIFINDFHTEYNKYIKTIQQPIAGDDPESILYLPLVTNDVAIGVITIQSFKKNAYTTYDLNILRNISIYVATALENAKAYGLIDVQKTEIEKKNIELEEKVRQRTEQLQLKNDEIIKQHNDLEESYRNVKLLSKIGQQITANLSLERIIETVYENVNNLMDATVFGIGIYNPDENRIEFPGSMENGKRNPPWHAGLDEERPAVLCFNDRMEIVINDYHLEYNKYIKNIPKPKAGQSPESMIYLPLMTHDGPIGTISVQSFKKNVYYQYHIDILRTLGSYITIAIQNANSYRKMTEAFEQLKSTQSKLIESEKMASLGVLTAGVAHEINNPINFISGGIQSLEENYVDLLSVVQLLLQYYADPTSERLREEIRLRKTDIHFDSLLPEIEQLINSIKNGADRTSEIVKGLRNFSRMDENDMKRANLEEGIDNTLVILNNQMKDKVTLVKEYGKVPSIICFPGQLNQVFMNILCNAADAIQGKGSIRIKTGLENGCIRITISDSGMGMPETVRSRVFEPFFTTKPVGKGTGLGLSIAYGIIEKHKGQIEVQSEEGKGTTFNITLPVK